MIKNIRNFIYKGIIETMTLKDEFENEFIAVTDRVRTKKHKMDLKSKYNDNKIKGND